MRHFVDIRMGLSAEHWRIIVAALRHYWDPERELEVAGLISRVEPLVERFEDARK